MGLQSLLKTVAYKMGFSIKRLRKIPQRGMARDQGISPMEVLRRLHTTHPCEGFDFAAIPPDYHGWGSDSTAFRSLMEELRPEFIIEVGTWKGGSALHMADLAQQLGLECHILCIDTWLGALEFWNDQTDPERYGSLKLRHGYPTVYYQFLANVCHRGHQDRIIPFPQTSAIAGMWLRQHGVRASMIYVDGSHEEEDVYDDLCNYWELVRPGGVLFGDDYSWDGVRLAVERFAREHRLTVAFSADKWLLRRTGVGK